MRRPKMFTILTARPALSLTIPLGWRIHCCVEVTGSSTNKQHKSLVGHPAFSQGHRDQKIAMQSVERHLVLRAATQVQAG
jgi:hypothetical protein